MSERAQSDRLPLLDVVDALCAQNLPLLAGHARPPSELGLPSRALLREAMEKVRAVLFPAHYGPHDISTETLRYHVGATLHGALRVLEPQVKRALCFMLPSAEGNEEEAALRAGEIVRTFSNRLPAVRALLATDVKAAFAGDPAASSLDEPILCYPGFMATLYHRVAHELHRLGVPLIPRMIAEESHATTGIDIHPAARIGGSFFIDHGTGVVIGETTIIGERVRLYQGVTLGAKSFPVDAQGNPIKGIDRHPVVEDDVVIYAGATILGRITIGRGSSIGGNVWLTRSVPAGSRITQANAQGDAPAVTSSSPRAP